MIKILVSIALLISVQVKAQNYPDPKLTPGVTRTATKKEICTAGSTKDARKVTAAMKAEVFKRYGFVKGKFKPGEYEIDHKISLELSGANDVANLWPQKYCPPKNKPLISGCWGAREKDVVETGLHRKICRGEITLEQAQEAIKTDWIVEYKILKTSAQGNRSRNPAVSR